MPIRRFAASESGTIDSVISLANFSPSGLKSPRLEWIVMPCRRAARRAGSMLEGKSPLEKTPAAIVTASVKAPSGITRRSPIRLISALSPACKLLLASSKGANSSEQSASKNQDSHWQYPKEGWHLPRELQEEPSGSHRREHKGAEPPASG